jgi:protein tyrosine phosphatase
MYDLYAGPKPNTLSDFWRMIWQEKVTDIVMLTNLIENGKVGLQIPSFSTVPS